MTKKLPRRGIRARYKPMTEFVRGRIIERKDAVSAHPKFIEENVYIKVQSLNRLFFHSTGTSRTPDSQTPGSRTAVHVLMGEKRKKCLERRNLTESTIVRRSIGLPVLFESCGGSAHTRP
ncbi:hypothetical protein TNCV_4080141 [Trichonephila clavipes]|nr:hypothetical protein TNCV_4080141 [Trichonephila clavipes]